MRIVQCIKDNNYLPTLQVNGVNQIFKRIMMFGLEVAKYIPRSRRVRCK